MENFEKNAFLKPFFKFDQKGSLGPISGIAKSILIFLTYLCQRLAK